MDCKSSCTLKICTDASNLAVGVVLEVEGHALEDASWLRAKDSAAHINLSELDAVIRGLNLAMKWGKFFEIMCHSAVVRCLVNGWLKSVIHHTHTVKTRALAEILIRRRLDTLKEMIEEKKFVYQSLKSDLKKI